MEKNESSCSILRSLNLDNIEEVVSSAFSTVPNTRTTSVVFYLVVDQKTYSYNNSYSNYNSY
jgi:hypothetical protein